ncbi:Hypothetical protein NTJ_11178 [Nesidiocoris tenuis]|uniref:Uncharacterized protein n=1 Tax=Nesidiocoris tenuis TaxID=355587 RepID=A0ABN7B290_9HEMI|nr:Hypothetical protein NTJ_11178 [Nesidiocoris tenuis]
MESSCPYLENVNSAGRTECGKWCKTHKNSTHEAIHRIDDSFIGHYKCRKWLEENVLVNDVEDQTFQPTTSVRCDFCRIPVSQTTGSNNRFRNRISRIFGKFKMNGIFNEVPEFTKLSRGDGCLKASIADDLTLASSFAGTYGGSLGNFEDDLTGPAEEFVDDSLSDIPEVKPSLKRFFPDEEPQFVPETRKPNRKSKNSKSSNASKI